jgi:hypothetical protein
MSVNESWPLPVCPPGMLQGPDGLPAKPEDVPFDYPIRIDWDGILMDNPGMRTTSSVACVTCWK